MLVLAANHGGTRSIVRRLLLHQGVVALTVTCLFFGKHSSYIEFSF